MRPLAGSPREARAASLCRIRAQAACTHCRAAPYAQVNSPACFTSPVVYKTAALPTELHRRETPSMLADPPNRLITPDTCPSSQQIWATAQFGAVSVRVLKTVALAPGREGRSAARRLAPGSEAVRAAARLSCVRCHRGYHRPFWELHRGKYTAKRRQAMPLVVTLGEVRAVLVLRCALVSRSAGLALTL